MSAALWLILIMLLLPAQASALDARSTVGWNQRLSASLPLDQQFVDEKGRAVRLSQFFTARPVILLLTYYDCPNLCGTLLTSLIGQLRRLDFNAAREFEVVVVSIAASDTPSAAARKKAGYLSLYDRSGSEPGWHFLTGTPQAIEALTTAVGFRYFYDAATRQYAHPAGIVIATPEGRIARYFIGLEFPQRELRYALLEASSGRIGSPMDRVSLLCYRSEQAAGKYGAAITDALRAGGALMIALVAGVVSVLLMRERSDGRGKPP